jgi:hypothetical protein
MKIKTSLIALSAFAVLIIATGCTSTVRVMPSEDDLVRVVARDAESHRAEKAAHKAAVKHCKEQGQVAVFLRDQVWYEGSMDEQARLSVRRQSQALGAAGVVLTASEHHEAGSVLESIGVAGTTITSGKDYAAEIWFRCDERFVSARQL